MGDEIELIKDEELNVFTSTIDFSDIAEKIKAGKELNETEKQFVLRKNEEYWNHHPDKINRFPRWRKYMAWIAGYQHYDVDLTKNELRPVKIKRKRKIIFNKIIGFVRTLWGKLVQDVPQEGVVSSTTEDADQKAAKIGDMVIQSLKGKLKFKHILDTLKLWLVITNKVYLRAFWDEQDFGITGYTETKDDVSGIVRREPTKEDGNIGLEVISPFQCRHDPISNDRDKWRWFVFGEEVDAEVLEKQYELKPGALKDTGEIDKLNAEYDLSMTAEGEMDITSPTAKSEVMGRTVLRMEFWTPEIYIYMAGNRVLEHGENEWEEIPYFLFEEEIIPLKSTEKDVTYNESLIKHIIPVQREYNRRVSIISEAIERASKLKILAPLGSMLSKQQMTDDMGVFIDINTDMGQPFQMKLDPMPPEIYQDKMGLEREFESIIGLHEASFGRLPKYASHASGALVNILLEQDDAVLAPILTMINTRLEKVWNLILKMVQENYTTPRLMQFVGRDKASHALKFQGSDLRGNTDVKVTSQSGIPRSRALRLEYLMQLRTQGVLQNDRKLLEILDFGDPESLFEEELAHERKANRENAKIEENPQINPQDVIGQPTEMTEKTGIMEGGWLYQFDAHGAHFDIHIRDRVSVKFEGYTENQKQALDGHIRTHYTLMMMQMAQQQKEQETEQPTEEGAEETQ